MLYDTIDVGRIKFTGASNNFRTLSYDGISLVFSLKNRYIFVKGIGNNRSIGSTILIHSKQYAEVVEQICAALNNASPVLGDGSFHAKVGDMTKIVGATREELEDAHFEACISLTFSSITKKSGSKVQVYVKDLALIKFVSNELEFDLDKLKLAD